MKINLSVKIFLMIIFLGGFLYSSCKGGAKKVSNKDLSRPSIDTIIRDVPKWLEENPDIWQQIARDEAILGLPSLQNGFDSIQIRIWIGCFSKDTQSIIVISNKNLKWDAKFYKYKLDFKSNINIESLKDQPKNLTPKSDWESFINSLMQTGIEKLPDYHTFRPNYALPNDAYAISVEIGKPKKYVIYQYPQLDLNKDIKGGPDQLEKALLLIEKEFNYKRPCQ